MAKTNLSRYEENNQNGIINGSFDYWQRNTTFATVASNTYTADRWRYVKNGSQVHTISRSTDVPTNAFGNYSMLIDCTTANASPAAGNYVIEQQHIEGNFFKRFRSKNIVLKFWVKATKTGINCVSFINNATNRSLVKEYTINQADTWEQKTIRFSHDSSGTWLYDTGIGMRVSFCLMAGSSLAGTPDIWTSSETYATSNQVNNCDSTANNFQLADVLFCLDNEFSTKDPEFQLAGRDLAEELQLCQRYYEKSYDIDVPVGTVAGSAVNGQTFFKAHTTTHFQDLRYKVFKRALPSIVLYNPITGGAGTWRDSVAAANRTVTTSDIGTGGFGVIVSATVDGNQVYGHWVADIEL